MKNRMIVVTGLGTVNPLGLNVQDFWKNLIDGKSGAAPITRFNASSFKTKFACEVKGFDPEVYITRKEIRKYDLFTQYALAAAQEAVKDSGFEFGLRGMVASLLSNLR